MTANRVFNLIMCWVSIVLFFLWWGDMKEKSALPRCPTCGAAYYDQVSPPVIAVEKE